MPAVKKYYDITGQTFPHRQIARDALMAGNDLLVLAQFAPSDHYEPQFANMRDTMRYFRQQYERDALFAKRVNEAAMRVIRLKLKLYPEFESENATLPPLPEPRFGLDTDVTQEVAEQAVSLIFSRTLQEFNYGCQAAQGEGNR